MDPTRMPYVFSLSTDSDALPQWRAYTHQHNGGYAIGFDGRSIARAVDANMTGDAHHGWNEFFMPCVYEGIDDIQFIVDGGIEIFAEIFESYFESKKPLRNRLYEENRVIDLLVVLSSFIKNGGFVAEREWRIVVKSDFVMTEFTKNSACLNELFQPYKHSGLADSSSESALCYRSKVNPSPDREIQYSRIEIRGGKPRIKTRLKDFRLGISPLMTDITISPHGDEDRLMITGLALLRNAGLHFMPQRTSHISYICR